MKVYEVEQKYRVRDPRALRAILKKTGAKKIACGAETNEFFDRKGSLSRRKIALRLRRFGGKAALTLKGPRLSSRFTKRLEIEAPVEYSPVGTILRLAGFEVIRRYKKRRELYRYGKCLVTLDSLDRFGWFLEIEGPVRDIAAAERRFGLKKTDREKRSYLHMLFGWKH